MAEGGLNKIRSLQKRYAGFRLLSDLFFAFAGSVMLAFLLYSGYSVPLWWGVLFFIVIGGMSRWRARQLDHKAIASLIDQKYPDLEESSTLSLKDPAELNILEKLQVEKLEAIFEAVPPTQKEFLQPLKFSLLLLLLVPLFCWLALDLHGRWQSVNPQKLKSGYVLKNTPPEKILPQVQSVTVTITPPAYTGNSQRSQEKFSIEAEEGSTVSWSLVLNTEAKEVSLIFNGGEKLALKKQDGGATYTGRWLLNKPGFYQVSIDGKLSDLYEALVIKDNPPVIHIKTPAQYTYIDAGEAPRVNINATVDDEYAVSDAFIYATIAKGSGEAVKFKEQKISFPSSFGGHNKHYDLKQIINLTSLTIGPGDELYFYIQAQDNHNQQTRSDVYIVAMQDTAQLLSMDGLISGLNIKPEYFRSERQIIMDTQQLLRDKDSISKQKFNERSNDIATDQKLLRLRYSKFLGEEDESAIDPRSAESNQPVDPKDFGNAAKILDEYTDKHDNAEDAQFFDPATKAQLRATLNEMWKAELQLRIYKPEAALPFEFKALRLLKDLQQQSRVYVAKTAYNPPPIKMEKRLTGDLSKISQPVNHQDIKNEEGDYASLKEAIGILEEAKTSGTLSASDKHVLQLANQQLSEKASSQPELYLKAVSALRHILSSGKVSSEDAGTVEKAIGRILPPGKALPNSTGATPDMGLSQDYYKNLNKGGR